MSPEQSWSVQTPDTLKVADVPFRSPTVIQVSQAIWMVMR